MQKTVVPAEAGTHGSDASTTAGWIPAFAGMTVKSWQTLPSTRRNYFFAAP
jgi:hypothetical protein